MKVLWIATCVPYPADNGYKIVLANRLQKAKERGIDIVFVAEGQPTNDSLLLLKAVTSKAILTNEKSRSKPYLAHCFIKSSLNLGRYYNEKIVTLIRQELKEKKFDLIIVEMPLLMINLPLDEIDEDIPICINQHNIESKAVLSKISVQGIGLLKKVYSRIESVKLKRWEQKMYMKKSVIAHTFVSDADMELFQREFNFPENTKFLCSPIGTNLPNSTETPIDVNNEIQMIMFPAAFDYAPNIHGAKWFVSNIMPRIKEKCPNAKVYLVGRNPTQEILNLSSSDTVVTGTVNSMVPYFKRANLFIVPLFFGGGMKTKLVEMGCYGKPTITTTSGITGTIYKSFEDVLVSDTVQDFAEYCIDTLLNPGKYEKMAAHMYQTTIDNYLWDSIGEKYCNFIENICGAVS